MSIRKTLRKTLCTIAATAVIGLSGVLGGCKDKQTGKYLYNSNIPLKDEGLYLHEEIYLQVDSEYNRRGSTVSVDWDGDGDLDVISNDGYGDVFLYENFGERFIKSKKPLFHMPAGHISVCRLDVVDIDKDGDLDIVANEGYELFRFYRNMSK